ncbi:hypothetical protein A3A39_03115 [Candidatus Kaiserbacteria bacterium RIFCSPLOWO2_01_FULL_54_13]|uniref:Helix-turn-helix domain-containing protein n=1 Tax=Candidatus Kaiserbacteria bacterium RIFCSPLOWO2_01_FULL_54_13 TaxID=1798512 RepID=A0A1F6F2G2_9BACT|nr:MAG: hypothetical protein A3A39_03115 [Candidatus Kaiserbacteria bacterium RIFCSPLOWO2_01_FULL_54_13]
MADQLQVAGVSYVSSKRAAQVSGYAQDYIGQLCRKGLVESQRIGGLWYVTLDSLYQYKQKADSYVPSAPQKSESTAPQTLVSFDGKDYLSASRAAEITGYHQDYIGQLAREGRVLSRQIGTRWYVERAGIMAHKKEKDALLGAVQSEAVGIRPRGPQTAQGNITSTSGASADSRPYFTYTSDEGDLLPTTMGLEVENVLHASEVPLEEHRIPIRVVEPKISVPIESTLYPEGEEGTTRARSGALRTSLAWGSAALATVVIVLTIGYVSVANNALYSQIRSESSSALASRAAEAISLIGDVLESWLAPEVVYRRQK